MKEEEEEEDSKARQIKRLLFYQIEKLNTSTKAKMAKINYKTACSSQ